MRQLVRGLQQMINKKQMRKQPYVDMDGFLVYYEKIGRHK